MKALIICSVHALCDLSRLERMACNHACEIHGIPGILTDQDHTRLLKETPVLTFLNRLAGTPEQRRELIDSYLEALNDQIWSASLSARQSAFSALLDSSGYARPRGFLSEYPMLTTNLIRSSALLTHATSLGTLTVPADPAELQSTATGLSATAASLDVGHDDVEVLVAHRRDFDAAEALGMHPRFVTEVPPADSVPKTAVQSRMRVANSTARGNVPPAFVLPTLNNPLLRPPAA
jgi:hypothetical protein